ncbi:MAG: NAD(P)-binding protein [Umezawaea sp.]
MAAHSDSSRAAGHTVVIGYGATGGHAARTIATRVPSGSRIPVVVDHDVERMAAALLDGLWFVLGDGADPTVLRQAGVTDAGRVVVAVPEGRDVVRIISAVRSLNPVAAIIALVREPGWCDSVTRAGADHIVVADREVGRRLGLMVRRGTDSERARPTVEREWAVARRPVRPVDVGRPAVACGPDVLAVVRDGVRHWREDPEVAPLRADDHLLVACTRAPTRPGTPW